LLLLERQVGDYEALSRLKNCCTDLQLDINFAKSHVTCYLHLQVEKGLQSWRLSQGRLVLPTTESHKRATKK